MPIVDYVIRGHTMWSANSCWIGSTYRSVSPNLAERDRNATYCWYWGEFIMSTPSFVVVVLCVPQKRPESWIWRYWARLAAKRLSIETRLDRRLPWDEIWCGRGREY